MLSSIVADVPVEVMKFLSNIMIIDGYSLFLFLLLSGSIFLLFLLRLFFFFYEIIACGCESYLVFLHSPLQLHSFPLELLAQGCSLHFQPWVLRVPFLAIDNNSSLLFSFIFNYSFHFQSKNVIFCDSLRVLKSAWYILNEKYYCFIFLFILFMSYCSNEWYMSNDKVYSIFYNNHPFVSSKQIFIIRISLQHNKYFVFITQIVKHPNKQQITSLSHYFSSQLPSSISPTFSFHIQGPINQISQYHE